MTDERRSNGSEADDSHRGEDESLVDTLQKRVAGLVHPPQAADDTRKTSKVAALPAIPEPARGDRS